MLIIAEAFYSIPDAWKTFFIANWLMIFWNSEILLFSLYVANPAVWDILDSDFSDKGV